MKRITFTKDALRTLGRLPTKNARLIRLKIEQYAADPSTQANNVKKLTGKDGVFRLRVGDWRVIFKETGEVIAVAKIAPRGRSLRLKDGLMTVQTIVTPAGERLVILPEAEYEELVEAAEDAADLAAVEAFERRLAAGEEEMIPSEIVDRILDGENRIHVWRDHRGLTADVLAERAGVALSELAEIESGQIQGSVATLRKIATAMNLSIDDLVA